jgi:hypothetical protein
MIKVRRRDIIASLIGLLLSGDSLAEKFSKIGAGTAGALTPANALLAEDGTTFLLAEDGVTFLTQES